MPSRCKWIYPNVQIIQIILEILETFRMSDQSEPSWSLPSNSSSLRAAGPSRHSAREAWQSPATFGARTQKAQENLGVDYNGTPKSSILIGFSIINHPFWGPTPIFGNIHIMIHQSKRKSCWKMSTTTPQPIFQYFIPNFNFTHDNNHTHFSTWHSDRNGALRGPVLQWLKLFVWDVSTFPSAFLNSVLRCFTVCTPQQ